MKSLWNNLPEIGKASILALLVLFTTFALSGCQTFNTADTIDTFTGELHTDKKYYCNDSFKSGDILGSFKRFCIATWKIDGQDVVNFQYDGDNWIHIDTVAVRFKDNSHIYNLVTNTSFESHVLYGGRVKENYRMRVAKDSDLSAFLAEVDYRKVNNISTKALFRLSGKYYWDIEMEAK